MAEHRTVNAVVPGSSPGGGAWGVLVWFRPSDIKNHDSMGLKRVRQKLAEQYKTSQVAQTCKTELIIHANDSIVPDFVPEAWVNECDKVAA